MTTECGETAWEYREQLYLLEVLVDDVTLEKEAGYAEDSSLLDLSAQVKFLDFPQMEVEPNELVITHRQRGDEVTESVIPGLPPEWEVNPANDLHDSDKFPQVRVKIPVSQPKPLKSYLITVLVPQIAVAAGEGLRYLYTALEKNTSPDIMAVIKGQLLQKIEKDNKKMEEQPLFPIKFASGKSCLFRLNPVELINGLKKFPLYLMMYRNGIVDSAPVNLLVGKVRLTLGEPFIRAILSVENSSVLPVSAHVEEMFQMEDIFGKKSGTVGLFVRLSCFGDSLSPPQEEGIVVGETKEERQDEKKTESERRRPNPLLATDEEMATGGGKRVAVSGRAVAWKRAGDTLPPPPKPALAKLATISLPLPPPRVEHTPDLADYLPDLPRCSPITPPPCYRRPGDPPLSRCSREMEAQLDREARTKSGQTEPYQPVQRLPPTSPYIDRTVPVVHQLARVPPQTPVSVPTSQGQPSAPLLESGCSNTCSGLQSKVGKPASPVSFSTKSNQGETRKSEDRIVSAKTSPDKSKASLKVISEDNFQAVTKSSKYELADNISDTTAPELGHRPSKRCTCQDLTPEQKKMKQKPPPCKCKRCWDKQKKTEKRKECPECERIMLSANMRLALQKISALEAEHNLTDSRVDAILREAYQGKEDVYDFPGIGKKPMNVGKSKGLDNSAHEITAAEREQEMREAFKDIIQDEVTKFEEVKKKKERIAKVEVVTEKQPTMKKSALAEGKNKKKKWKRPNLGPTDLEETLKWMYPGHNHGHKTCVRPFRLVPKSMGWLWNLSTFNGVLKPGRGWRPGAIRAEVNDLIKVWRRERRVGGGFMDDDMSRRPRTKRKPGTSKSSGSKRADSIHYNPTLHMLKEGGFYYISMYPNRSTSMDKLGEDPKPVTFKINAKHPDGSAASTESSDSSTDKEPYEIEFITPTAMRKQIRKPPKVAVSAQYLEEDFLPKTKKKKAEVEPQKPAPEATGKGKDKKGKRKGKGKKKHK